jgi:Uma2 family endonuclease
LLKPVSDFYAEKRIAWEDALLVIEVSDTTIRRDRNFKSPLYAKAGVSELWIEDLQRDAIFVYREPGPEGYAVTHILQRGDTISIVAFPGITFQVSDLIG